MSTDDEEAECQRARVASIEALAKAERELMEVGDKIEDLRMKRLELHAKECSIRSFINFMKQMTTREQQQLALTKALQSQCAE